ncbi:MAG TPA: nucleotidyltransferase family protein [Solirubrobacteraceae bacterium]
MTDSAGAPSPTLSPEYRLLTAAATPDPPWPDAVASSVDWSRVLELARHHRLEALLHWHLDRAELTAPDFAQEKLHSQRERTVTGELGARRQLQEVSAVLAAAAIRPVALKGAALLESAYLTPGLRPMVDLDLLVDEAQLDTAVGALTASGYHPHPALRTPTTSAGAERHHHHDPLVRQDRWLTVELHRTAGPALSARASDELAGRALPSQRGPHLIPTPGDHILVLAAHFTTDRELGSQTALGQLADLAHVIAHADVAWPALVDAATRWGVAGRAYTALYAVGELGLAEVPAEVLAGLAPDGAGRATAHTLLAERVLATEPRLMLSMRSFPGSARQWLFPGGDYMRARYHLPEASLRRLYLTRLQIGGELALALLRHPRRALSELRFGRHLSGR